MDDASFTRALLAGLAPLIATAATSSGVAPVASVGRVRDLLYLKVSDDLVLVISADSNAAIGSKPNDVLDFSPEATGRSVTQVAIMEVLAVGARPVIVVDNLCVEMEPTGRRILSGVESAVAELAEPVIITGSDETNMPTSQTGVGVTVIAVAHHEELLIARCNIGDVVVLVGVPVGGPTHLYDEFQALEFAGVGTLTAALATGVVHEVLPVGSRGVGFELSELARTSGLVANELLPSPVAMGNSGGASTSFLVALAADDLPAFRSAIDRPVHIVATLQQPLLH
ncbi:hypothetical protein BH10ACT7_BH10ACT7_07010 [soil metagenome]